jgi:hypothetical protein
MNRAIEVARKPIAKMPIRSKTATMALRPRKVKYFARSLELMKARDFRTVFNTSSFYFAGA